MNKGHRDEDEETRRGRGRGGGERRDEVCCAFVKRHMIWVGGDAYAIEGKNLCELLESICPLWRMIIRTVEILCSRTYDLIVSATSCSFQKSAMLSGKSLERL